MLNNIKSNQFHKKDLNILYSFNELICEKNLLKPKQRILICVSGGQDSMCLIKLLFRLQTKWNWTLGIIHCDHQWNSMSKLQGNYVSQLAYSMKLDYYQVITVNSINSEVSARTWRYHLITQIAYRHKYDVILTAHTANDRIETFFYNLFRGSSINGLQALAWKKKIILKIYINNISLFNNIDLLFQLKYKENIYQIKIHKYISVSIIRPLLITSRLEIRFLLKKWNFPVWVDPSNRFIAIYRNRIRHRLIPYIRLYFQPKFDQAITNCLELVQCENIHLYKLANYIKFQIQIFSKNEKKHYKYKAIPIAILGSLPIFLQRRIIKLFIDNQNHNKMIYHQIEHLRIKALNQIHFSKNIQNHTMLYSNLLLYKGMNFPISYKEELLITNHFIFIQRFK